MDNLLMLHNQRLSTPSCQQEWIDIKVSFWETKDSTKEFKIGNALRGRIDFAEISSSWNSKTNSSWVAKLVGQANVDALFSPLE